jgi:uncharacterized protein YjgD (DUF1641 family)
MASRIYDSFKEAMDAVEENNDINDGTWSSWDDGEQILQTYEIAYNGRVAKLLDEVIKSNNKQDIAYNILKKLEKEDYGYNFSDNSDRYKKWQSKSK